MRAVRSVYRSLVLVLLLIVAVIDGQVRKWFFGLIAGPAGAVWVSGWCRRLLRLSGIRLTVDGALPKTGAQGLALISNHLSYLDILIYSAIQPSIMVAKKEVRGWPLIGWITAQAGTVYVERADIRGGQQQSHAEVNAMMAEAYRSGLPVLFYPEGTTTDGRTILPFRRGLFHSILKDAVPLQVAAIAYSLDAYNRGVSIEYDICYWGDMVFGPHLFCCLGMRGLHAHVTFNPNPVPGGERFSLASNARLDVVRAYRDMTRRNLLDPTESLVCQSTPDRGSFEPFELAN